jgi:hypothetical protein
MGGSAKLFVEGFSELIRVIRDLFFKLDGLAIKLFKQLTIMPAKHSNSYAIYGLFVAGHNFVDVGKLFERRSRKDIFPAVPE